MIVKVLVDEQKAKSLARTARITYERLRETNVEKYASNSVTDYYDIIHQYFEAITCLYGAKIKGEGAHQELVDYVSKKEGFPESERMFLQELRDYRNRINYEGFFINPEYVIQNKERIEKIIKKLANILNEKLN